ncbi:hypothetical protein M0811_13275 [Anaeramoeba ignava]|uniref:Uncharacterized protein n=1 Tax=Anaeramoeba ignava TaxID=1746090 RepID=A0A9Q0L813_ANAIG|nr:hypothetical protein M0811_13275 [Anaeramoeba ignava]
MNYSLLKTPIHSFKKTQKQQNNNNNSNNSNRRSAFKSIQNSNKKRNSIYEPPVRIISSKKSDRKKSIQRSKTPTFKNKEKDKEKDKENRTYSFYFSKSKENYEKNENLLNEENRKKMMWNVITYLEKPQNRNQKTQFFNKTPAERKKPTCSQQFGSILREKNKTPKTEQRSLSHSYFTKTPNKIERILFRD